MSRADAAAEYDVAIVGAGVVGAAIARELARFELRCVLLESGPDVGAGTSKANTALLHTGFDAKPGTLESRLVRRGHALLRRYAAAAGIPLEPTGALLVAWDEEQLAALPGIVERSRANGYTAIREVARRRALPARAAPRARRGRRPRGPRRRAHLPLHHRRSPSRPRRCSAAASCGATRPVTGVERLPERGFRVATPTGGALTARWLVNAAGLRSDEVDRMLGHDRFTVTPAARRADRVRQARRPLVRHDRPAAVPTETTKGVLVAPTVFGNVMVGPTAEDVERKDDTSSTADGPRLPARARRRGSCPSCSATR